MSNAFSDKIYQIVDHYPGINCGSAFSESPVTKFFLSPVPEVWIHIFQIQIISIFDIQDGMQR